MIPSSFISSIGVESFIPLFGQLHTLCHLEDIRFIVYIRAILDYAADFRGDGPAKIGTLANFALECVIRIYFTVPSVFDLCKVDHHTDCIRVQPGSLPILI